MTGVSKPLALYLTSVMLHHCPISVLLDFRMLQNAICCINTQFCKYPLSVSQVTETLCLRIHSCPQSREIVAPRYSL